MGIFYGGYGSDTITPSYVSSEVYDLASGTPRPATTRPGADDDTLYGGWSPFDPYHGGGNDTLDGGARNDWLYGGRDDDLLIGGVGNDNLFGGDGFDALFGQAGDDTLDGEEGDDWLDGGTGADWIAGGEGKDGILLGDANAGDFADGGQGIDNLDLNASNATVPVVVSGGQVRLGGTLIATGFENFWIQGGSANDRLVGGAESGTLVGNGGDDVLDQTASSGGAQAYGGDGNDRLISGAMDDHLSGGNGIDVLVGGAGDDSFYFDGPNEGGDIIEEFGDSLGDNDRIVISAQGFGLEDGLWGWGRHSPPLDASSFQAGPGLQEAQDADDRFIFNTDDATLWFDSDGLGGSQAVLIADMQEGLNLTWDDIVIT